MHGCLGAASLKTLTSSQKLNQFIWQLWRKEFINIFGVFIQVNLLLLTWCNPSCLNMFPFLFNVSYWTALTQMVPAFAFGEKAKFSFIIYYHFSLFAFDCFTKTCSQLVGVLSLRKLKWCFFCGTHLAENKFRNIWVFLMQFFMKSLLFYTLFYLTS